MESEIKVSKSTLDLCKRLILSELKKSKDCNIYSKNYLSRLKIAKKELDEFDLNYSIKEILCIIKEKL